MLIKKGNPTIMGCNIYRDGYNFSFESEADEISLILADLHLRRKKKIKLDGSYKVGSVFSVHISKADMSGLMYCYEADGVRYTDPYAKAVTGCFRYAETDSKGKLFSPVCIEEYDWEDDKPLNLEYNECIFYKLNVRGFTKSRTSKVSDKGTFAGIVNKIGYLKELGVTSLELQPAYEYDEIGRFPDPKDSVLTRYKAVQNYTAAPADEHRVNYWGYVGGLYFAPKASFCAHAPKNNEMFRDYTGEFKDMVKALHKAGIEVIMEMFFTEKSTGFIIECVKYWVCEYHIDGVHVYCDENTLKALSEEPMLANTKIITVHWGGGMGSRKHMADYNNDFQNIARRFLKGDENILAQFAAASRKNEENSASINYVANNNGFTLMDLVSYDRKHNEINGENNRDGEDFNYSWNCGEEGATRKKRVKQLRLRQIKNALAMVILSGGTPLIMAGDEFGNSQSGNNNPYCIDSELSWVNWKDTKESKIIFEWTRKLISMRRNNGILHMPHSLTLGDRISCGYPDISYHGTNAWYAQMQIYDRHIGILYSCVYGKDEDYRVIYVAYNMHWEPHGLALPKLEGGSWKILLSSNESGAVLDEDSRLVRVEPRSMTVLEGTYKLPNARSGNRKKSDKAENNADGNDK